MSRARKSGILLHVTSLPSPFGIGDLGPGASRFVDFLHRAGQRLWQVLPLVPAGYGYSPYSSPSTFAGNPYLLSPRLLADDGLLTEADFADRPDFEDERVDFEWVFAYKHRLLQKAAERFEAGQGRIDTATFESFCAEEHDWLEDYALFAALKETHDGAWTDWPADLASREPDALRRAHEAHAEAVRRHRLWQFLFSRQWKKLRAYAAERGIEIFGDLPIYVAHDSADVWANRALFHLDEHGRPTVVAGVPPDYFSETGQRWGNPIYRWDRMAEHDYDWWTRRLARALDLYDLVRLDHFRGFEAYWEVPAEEETAVHGRWVEGPGADLFEALQRRLGGLPIVAENLGLITDGVKALREQFGLPGMAVLQFAFDSDADADFLPHNHVPHLVAYTGTHDNDTLRGWWETLEARARADGSVVGTGKPYARAYLGVEEGDEVPWAGIRAVMSSVAETVVFPLQDVLALGPEARMNVPGRSQSNWAWRFPDGALNDAVADRLRTLTEIYGRALEDRG